MVYHLTMEERAECMKAHQELRESAKRDLIIEMAIRVFAEEAQPFPSPDKLDDMEKFFDLISMIIDFRKEWDRE